MQASKMLVKLIQQKQEKKPGLSHEEAYCLVSSENPEAVNAFLKELGLQEQKPLTVARINADKV
jgi:hypothetical protein